MTVKKIDKIVRWGLMITFAITVAGWGGLVWYLWNWGWHIYTIVGITFTTVMAALLTGIFTGVYAIIQSALKHKIVTLEQVL